MSGFTLMKESLEVSPVQIFAETMSVTLVGADGSVSGMGFQTGARKGFADETNSAEFRTFKFPDTFNVADVKKYAIGKFNRYVLMNDGRIYW